MNGLPIAFCGHLCQILSIDGLCAAKELSGNYGVLARCAFEQRAEYVGASMDGVEVPGCIIYECSGREARTSEEIEAVPKNLVRVVTIHLMDSKEEKVSRELVRRFPYSQFDFVHHTSSINEAWVDFAFSLKRLRYIGIMKTLNDDSLYVLQKLITSGKISALMMHPEACEGDTMELGKSLLCQEQFEELEIRNVDNAPWKGAPIRELLEFWTEESGKLKGKCLVLQEVHWGGVAQLAEFLFLRKFAALSPTLLRIPDVASLGRSPLGIQWALEVCSKEECRFIDKNYFHNHVTYAKPSCFYKFEEAEGDGKRRFYISFECAGQGGEGLGGGQWMPASYRGIKDLRLLRDTSFLCILFA
uniref:F-box/LRR-repeat protein n=1 Tax=Steinernema glaseri TaxID=37863 RepID=A0A1I8ALF7_9BILA